MRATLKDRFLAVYEEEHEITMRLLRAFPEDKLELRPHPKTRTARELAWLFVLERGLGAKIVRNEFAAQAPGGGAPPGPPEGWDAVLGALEKAHKDFGDLIRGLSEDQLLEGAKFFVGPKTLGEKPLIEWLWFLLHDQIHHRGQFSIYSRMAEGRVPSIYGPSGDEPYF